ncbi:MAG: hypothetical protein BWY76_01901 [bacterium ADurb.Bin429]|nr:MAG: hypothetical protein BWY76_01901 [bacterium ADurb.Bin429]
MRAFTFSQVFMLIGMVLFAGCSGNVDTAGKLANALKKKGVNYTATEALAMPPLPMGYEADEAIALTGDNLRVEIYRVESEKYFKIFHTAVMTAVVFDGATPGTMRTKPIARQPFIVVIRQEPRPGGVKDAMDQIIPPAEAEK